MSEIKQSKWVPTADRFVVFLDIMGFKDFVSRNSHETVYESLQFLARTKDNIIQTTQRTINDVEVHLVSFSDSIIMFSKDDSPKSLEHISVSAAFILQEAITHNIPIKGGMAHGKVTVNKSQQIFFGQPIIDAYELEEDVCYYGISAHHTIDEFLHGNRDNISPWAKNVLYKEIPTPLKSGSIKHHNLNWFELIIMSGTNNTKSIIQPECEKLLRLLKNRTSGAPRRYIDNTEKVFHEMYPDNITDPENNK